MQAEYKTDIARLAEDMAKRDTEATRRDKDNLRWQVGLWIAAMAGALLLLAAVPAHAQDRYGAIAFGGGGYGESVAYGLSWNYATKDEATGAAMNACRGAGGAGCAELAWFRNGCGALAMDSFGNHAGKAARSQEQAETRALRSCEAAGGSGCAVVDSQCAEAGGEPDTWSGSESVQEPPEEKPAASASAEADAAPEEALTRQQRVMAQRGLAALGYEPGPADGLFGPRTRSAIWEWQEAKGIEATGYLTREQAEALAAVGADAPGQAAAGESEAGSQAGKQAAAPEAADGPRPFENKVLRLPECEGMPEGSECWELISNKPGCRLWTSDYNPPGDPDIATKILWSGGCDGGAAHGQGTLSYVFADGNSNELTGEMVSGKRQGHWVARLHEPDDLGEGTYLQSAEGPYVDSKRHGRWVHRLSNGKTYEYHFVHGELQN